MILKIEISLLLKISPDNFCDLFCIWLLIDISFGLKINFVSGSNYVYRIARSVRWDKYS